MVVHSPCVSPPFEQKDKTKSPVQGSPVGPACAELCLEADCLSLVLPGSLSMSLAAAMAADQMCRLPEASHEAMWGLPAPPVPSQHSSETGLL